MTAASQSETDCDPTTSGDQSVALRWVGWDGYRKLLKMRGERPRPRMAYLDGTVWLSSTSFAHERISSRFGALIMEVVVNCDLPCVCSGSTTFYRKHKRCGAEPDKSYYLANAWRILGNTDIDLRVDPPPDLVIEIVNPHPVDVEIEAYRRLKVPEVWVYKNGELRIGVFREGRRRYQAAKSSAAFPFLTSAEITEWINRPVPGSETDWLKLIRRWGEDELAPRARQQAGSETTANPEAEGNQ